MRPVVNTPPRASVRERSPSSGAVERPRARQGFDTAPRFHRNLETGGISAHTARTGRCESLCTLGGMIRQSERRYNAKVEPYAPRCLRVAPRPVVADPLRLARFSDPDVGAVYRTRPDFIHSIPAGTGSTRSRSSAPRSTWDRGASRNGRDVRELPTSRQKLPDFDEPDGGLLP